jgi:3-oxoacyl-(acyl-carrier-protein) synthase
MRKVYVTGMGIVSAAGIGTEANRSALLSGKSGIGFAHFLSSNLKDSFPLAEISYAASELRQFITGDGSKLSNRLTLLAAIAIEEAIGTKPFFSPDSQVGFINATTVGGMGDVEDLYASLIEPGNNMPASNLGDALDCAHGTEELARYFGFGQFISTVSTACSSSANSLMYAARLIGNGMLDTAICGGTDTLTRFTLNGFNSLKNIDKHPCKPFDENRNGLNLGEGAAYLVLQTEEMMLRSGREPLAVFSGYCNYNEAFHPTAPSPEGEGAFQAMKGALKQAGLDESRISFINAHGTATLNNDLAEAFAMQRLFGDNMPAFTSTKTYTGHTLAASGAIEAVFSILNILHKEMYPVLNFSSVMPEVALEPLTVLKQQVTVDHVLSNSFGFGGNNASLIFSKYA